VCLQLSAWQPSKLFHHVYSEEAVSIQSRCFQYGPVVSTQSTEKYEPNANGAREATGY